MKSAGYNPYDSSGEFARIDQFRLIDFFFLVKDSRSVIFSISACWDI
jgi:hypothetical protein